MVKLKPFGMNFYTVGIIAIVLVLIYGLAWPVEYYIAKSRASKDISACDKLIDYSGCGSYVQLSGVKPPRYVKDPGIYDCCTILQNPHH